MFRVYYDLGSWVQGLRIGVLELPETMVYFWVWEDTPVATTGLEFIARDLSHFSVPCHVYSAPSPKPQQPKTHVRSLSPVATLKRWR